MTEFKIGDRVEWRGLLDRERRTGTIDTVTSVAGQPTVYSGPIDGETRRFDRYAHNLTKITDPTPLRFSDVRTGDMITVETGEPNVTLITGIAEVNEFTGEVRIPGLSGWYWNDETTPGARLTAHVPAEPEWHRAKVIKAGNDYLVRCASTGVFRDQQGVAWSTDELTNVTIIVDAEGQVRA
jgi:hypothetical protein